MTMPVRSGQRFLFVGDSITDCGRRDRNAPFGDGYASLFIERFTAEHPDREVRWMNRGISGNTVQDLLVRWADDVIQEQPDWLTIMIGVNDMNQTLQESARSVPPKEYEELYQKILERVRESTKAKIVLLDPFYISLESRSGWWRDRALNLLQDYIRIVARLANKYKTGHVKTQAIFQKQLKFRTASHFGHEPVHPYRIGHSIMAHHLYETVSGMK